MSKYGNKKTELYGITFDSQREASRWLALKALERGGYITDLKRQVPIELVTGIRLPGSTRKRPAIRLVVDFVYRDNKNQLIYEDSKGMETQVSKIKRHLAKALHGIEVKTV